MDYPGNISTTPWFERRFNFDKSQFIFPSILVRLEGTPLRLLSKVQNLNDDLVRWKPEGKWSIKEHIAHLADLELLWQNRCQDILNKLEYMRETDLTNSQIDRGNYNEKPLQQLVNEFTKLRTSTLDTLAQLSHDDILSTALHPRLHQPMSIHDLFLFVAEHDDHHLAFITQIITSKSV